MNVEEPFQLKHTNVSRPQVQRTESKQSITASEDYYSLSEKASSSSDDRSKLTAIRYATPPSRRRSPEQSEQSEQSHEPQQSEAAHSSLKGVGKTRQYPPQTSHAANVPRTPIPEEDNIEQRDSEFSQAKAHMDSETLSTTPGMDETPYIRFAIDQLTRDEEVRGSRQYPQLAPDEEYPVERIVSDDGLGYMEQEQEKERRLTRPPPPRPPRRDLPRNADPAIKPETFIPFYPAKDSLQHPSLDFMPGILHLLWLGIFIFLCLLMLAALIASAIYSNQHHGLWDYISFGDSRYFVFEYLPQMLGIVILLWLFQIQTALQRIIPFISMASESSHKRTGAVFLELHPTQFFLPKFEHFRAGQPLIGACFVIFWLFLWTIPLLASSFNVRYDADTGAWRWIAVQGVIWTTIVLYILLILALIALAGFLFRKQTGLKWDPRSLADIVALLERSNIMNDYNGSETFEKREFRQRLFNRTDRLGYWHTSRRPNDVFYGIGEEGGATRRYSIEQGRIREKGPEREYPGPTGHASNQRPGDFSIRMDIRSPSVRLKYLPWYLRDTYVIAWIVIAFVLLLAFLIVSFVNSAVRDGFLPQIPARANSAGFSASNFLYSFVPAFIGTVLFLALLSFDYTFRNLQPYISLSTAGGATAETSLLADYPCRLPLSITLSALGCRHYQVAYLSFMSLLSITLPILAGGCFWTQFYPNSTEVRVAAHLPAYYALCFFLALYTLSLFVLLPNRRRAALPHRAGSLAEIISWVYQSQILTDRAFSRPQTKPELVARLMGTAYTERPWTHSLKPSSKDNLRDDGGKIAAVSEKGKGRAVEGAEEKRSSVSNPGAIRYGFGIHVGRDGLEHLGIDRVRRGGERSGRELVIWEEQRRRSFAGSV